MAQLGAIPAQLPEWGALRPFQTDYLPVTAHTAAAMLLRARRPADRPRALPAHHARARRCCSRRSCSAAGCPAGPPCSARSCCSRPSGSTRSSMATGPRRSPWSWPSSRCGSPTARSSSGALGRSPWRSSATALVFLSHAEVFLILAPALVGIAVARTLIAPGGRGSRIGAADRAMAPGALGSGPGDRARSSAVGALGAAGGWALTGESRDPRLCARPGRTAARGPRARPSRRGPGRVDLHGRSRPGTSTSPRSRRRSTDSRRRTSSPTPSCCRARWSTSGRASTVACGPGCVVLLLLTIAPLLAWPFLDARRRRFVLGWALFGAASSSAASCSSPSPTRTSRAGRRVAGSCRTCCSCRWSR